MQHDDASELGSGHEDEEQVVTRYIFASSVLLPSSSPWSVS
jgi:hypothetical protein